jgi:hypothetical protein
MAASFISDPTTAVEHMVQGILLAHPDLVRLGDHAVLLRRDFASGVRDAGKVAVLSGGGSGTCDLDSFARFFRAIDISFLFRSLSFSLVLFRFSFVSLSFLFRFSFVSLSFLFRFSFVSLSFSFVLSRSLSFSFFLVLSL